MNKPSSHTGKTLKMRQIITGNFQTYNLISISKKIIFDSLGCVLYCLIFFTP